MLKVENYEALETYSNSNTLTVEQVMSDLHKWDPNNFEEYKGHTSDIWCLRSTSSNSHLFSGGGDEVVLVWDNATGQVQSRLTGHSNTVNILEITSNDESLISGCWSGQIFKWDWKKGQKTGEFLGSQAGVFCSLIFKQFLITGSGDSNVRVWQIEDCSIVSSTRASQSSIFGLACFSYQNDFIVTGDSDKMLNVWKVRQNLSLAHVKTYFPDKGCIQALVCSPNSLYLIAGTRENFIIVFELPALEQKACLSSHTNWVRSLCVSHDSKFFFSASADKTVKLFTLDNVSEKFSFDQDEGHLFCVYLSKDQSFLYSAGAQKVIKKRKLWTFSSFKRLSGHQRAVNCLFISPDSSVIVSGADDGVLKVWDLVGMREIQSFKAHEKSLRAVSMTSNMKYLLSAGDDCLVQVWDYFKMTLLAALKIHEDAVFALSVSADNLNFASGGQDKKLMFYSFEGFQHIHTFEGHTDSIFTVKFSDSYLFSGSADYTVRIWDVTSLTFSKKIDIRAGMIEALNVSKDSSVLFIGDRRGVLTVWDLRHNLKKEELQVHNGSLKSISLSADDRVITGGNDQKTVIININEKVTESSFKLHQGPVLCVGITSDSRCLISGSQDSSLIVWTRNDSSSFRVNSFLSSFDSFLFLLHLTENTVPSHELCLMTISPLKLTLAHFYAYYANSKLLDLALNNGVDLRKDLLGNSPLHYALNRKAQTAVESIIRFLINVKPFEKFLNLVWSIRSDFERLLGYSCFFLNDFLEKLLFCPNFKHLKKFGVPKRKLPIFLYKDENFIENNDFLNDFRDNQREVSVEFQVLPFPVSFELGSESSISMLKNIFKNENKEILQSRVVTIIVKSRWDDFWYFILIISLVYWINIVIMIVLLVHDTKNVPGLFFYGILNFLLLLYEILQLHAVGFKEYLNFWNLVDQGRIFTCFIWIILAGSIGETEVIWLSYIMVILNFLRGLSAFRVFSKTRFYATLILKSLVKVFPFILIFFYTTLFFGMLSWTGRKKKGTAFETIWKDSFELNMGSFDNSDELDYDFIYFMFGSVFNVIIIINLLISILGDNYDNFRDQYTEIENLEMVEIVLEIETLMTWKRKKNEKKYLQICQLAESEVPPDSWKGKVKMISSMIKKEAKHVNSCYKYIKAGINRVEEKVNLH